ASLWRQVTLRRVRRQCSQGRLISPESVRTWDWLADENATMEAVGHLGSVSRANPASFVTRKNADGGRLAPLSKCPTLAAVSTVSAGAGQAARTSDAASSTPDDRFELSEIDLASESYAAITVSPKPDVSQASRSCSRPRRGSMWD